MAKLTGKVRSGLGNFSFWIERLQDIYESKTGTRFYPGTLNVELESEYRLPPRPIRLEAAEYGGSVSVNIVPCRLNGVDCFLLRTDANEDGTGHHPRTIIEIAAGVRLRDHLNLRDGDVVVVEIEDA